MERLTGSCHCGAIGVRFETARAPHELPVRVCGCSFCLRHRPRYTSDPQGLLTFEGGGAGAGALARYRFGLRLADFLICRTCGVFVGAIDEEAGRGVLNLAVLERAADFTADATEFTAYDTEDAAARRARRERAWTPACLVVTP